MVEFNACIFSYLIYHMMLSKDKLMLQRITSILKGFTIYSGNTLCWSSPSGNLSFSFCVLKFWRNRITITWKCNRKNVLFVLKIVAILLET